MRRKKNHILVPLLISRLWPTSTIHCGCNRFSKAMDLLFRLSKNPTVLARIFTSSVSLPAVSSLRVLLLRIPAALLHVWASLPDLYLVDGASQKMVARQSDTMDRKSPPFPPFAEEAPVHLDHLGLFCQPVQIFPKRLKNVGCDPYPP